MARGDKIRGAFQDRLNKIVAGACKASLQAHGEVLPSSVAKRVAAELWALTSPKAHPDVSSWVRHVRGQLGWSQQDLADTLGVGRVTVARWETGTQVPGTDALEALEDLARRHGQE